MTFSAWGGGTPPVAFQWLKNGSPLQNSSSVTGANSSVLKISNLLGADAGDYAMVVTTASGAITREIFTWLPGEPVYSGLQLPVVALPGQISHQRACLQIFATWK